MAGKFEIFKDKAGEFRFRLKSGNGETVLTSEGYSKKASAVNGVESVKKNAGDAANFDKSETDGGGFRFALKAKNRQIIGTSQTYKTASGRDNGVGAVGRAADGANVVDLSDA